MSSISEFRAKVVAGGFSKTARYRVVINSNQAGIVANLTGSNLSKLQYMCEQAELPGRTLNAADVHYYGAGFKSPSGTLYNPSSFTFLVSENMDERIFFDSWLDYINGANDGSGYDMKFRSNYGTTIDVFQLGETETINDPGRLQFTLIDAWPLAINPMPISYADENFHRIQIDFVYTDYSFKRPG